jgi:hypothetical protein
MRITTALPTLCRSDCYLGILLENLEMPTRIQSFQAGTDFEDLQAQTADFQGLDHLKAY